MEINSLAAPNRLFIEKLPNSHSGSFAPGKCWKREAGSWKLEAGSWKLEAGSWKLEAGSWKLEAGSWSV